MGKRKASQTPKQTKSTSDSESEHKKVRKKGKFKCKVCAKIFTEKSNLRSHAYVHTSDTPFACPYAPECLYRGKTKKYLSRHVKNNHQKMTNKHKCDVCGKFFHHPSSLKVHAMVHTGEKPHICNVCGKTFRVTYTLNTHMLTHTNEKPFQCSFCDYACRDSSTLRKHQNKHMGLESIYECKICDKSYKTRSALKLHLAEIHLEENVRIYPCDRCGRSFKKKCQRRRHILSFHERALTCTCPVCGRTIASRLQLSTHLRSHLSERPFACTHDGCGLAFKTKGCLSKHSAIHDPSLHHACSYCGRKFVRKTHVQRHERVMHRERRRGVECHYCGARFYSKNYLLKHIQIKHIHKNRFKYICDICGLTTHNKPSIVMHLKYGHSNDNDMQCKLCDGKKVYKRHMYLKLHYWKTHNVRYKITRKPTNKPKKEKDEAGVEIKVEPIEAESYEEIQLLDVKEEHEDCTESMDYSKRVLSEDIAASLLQAKGRVKGRNTKEIDFDDFFVRNVYPKREKPQDVNINAGVDEEQNEIVKQKIKQILVRSKKREDAKALKKKQIQEEKNRIQKELEEAQMQAERERQKIIELKRVREMYNEIMKAALTKERERKSKGKDQVKIKYFKKKPDEVSGLEDAEKNRELENSLEDDKSDDSNDTNNTTDMNNEETLDSDDNEPNDDVDKTITSNDLSDVNDMVPDENDANTARDKDVTENVSKDVMTTIENDKDELTYNNKIDEKLTMFQINKGGEGNTYRNDEENINNESLQEIIEDEAMDIDTVLSDTFFDNHEDNNIENYLDNQNIISQVCCKNNTVQESITNNNEINNDVCRTLDIQSGHGNTPNNDNEVINFNEIEELLNKVTSYEMKENKFKETVGNELTEIHSNTKHIKKCHGLSSKSTENTINNEIQVHDKNIDNRETQETSNVEDLKEINEDITKHDKEINDDYLDIPLSERIKKKRNKQNYKEDKSWSDEENGDEETGVQNTRKMEFKSHQCYVCFKLYQTKTELIDHCQEHFDICNERTLTKCPICNYISYKSIVSHMKTKHKITVKIPFNKIKDRQTDAGSKYCYDVDGTDFEIIPSVRMLNKTASDNIDRKRREANDKTIAKPKLVRKGIEWIVEKEAVDIKYDEIPELTDRELHKCKLTDNDVDRLGQLSYLAKKKGLKMMFPCFKCDKICLNFCALKLHKRRHEDNPKPFKRRVKRNKEKETKKAKEVKLDKSNRTAMPKPITNKHKCDAGLRDFYENNIRGGDIEFWQFLKIFNRMDKEQVNDFKDLEARSDFGNHLDYYKDVGDEIADDVIAGEIDDTAGRGDVNEIDGDDILEGSDDGDE